jgi:hypothetical protein
VGNSGLTLIAQAGSGAPGSNGALFSGFSNPVFNDNDSVAFVGTLKISQGGATASTNSSVWATTGGALHLIARTGDPAPGCGLARFSSFHEIACTNSGRVAFLGTVDAAGFTAANNQGLWEVDSTQRLQLVVRLGGALTVNGVEKVISLLDVFSFPTGAGGQTRNVTNSNYFFFRAKFTDGTQGLFGSLLP